MYRALLYAGYPADKNVIPFSTLAAHGWKVFTVSSLQGAIPDLRSTAFHVGLLDCRTRALRELNDYWHELHLMQPYVQWVALLSPEMATDHAMREFVVSRFYDYHTLPVDPNRLLITLGHAYGMSAIHNPVTATIKDLSNGQELIGDSAVMQAVRRKLFKFGRVDAPVLLTGESGTGKELASLAIHRQSQRHERPFVAINCGALPPTLIQSELFGYEKGAFTGAHQRRLGRIEAAKGGTVFLDEIGDLPLDLQANLLRVLQEGYIERLGSWQRIEADVRIIAATNIDLQRAVMENRFRSDLYYRLDVLRLEMPPLREREEDIESLSQYFFAKFARETAARAIGFTREAIRVMKNHDWPGNIRELINRIRQALVMSDTRLIEARDLGLDRRRGSRYTGTLEAVRAQAEQQAIKAALQRSGYNFSAAARELGVSRGTVYNLLAKYNKHNIVEN